MRSWTLCAPLLLLSLSGCAAAFRDSQALVHFETDPQGADLEIKGQGGRKSPVDVDVSRGGTTPVKATKPGFKDSHGVVKKKLNAAWVTVDIITCPITLCFPLVVDAISGALNDVAAEYKVKLEPGVGSAPLPPTSAATPPPPVVTPPTGGPPPDMSESERKATARAAFLEGAQMQENNNCAEALPRFETAQKFYPAPTHLLHLGECQAAVGKLVEAQETYETLTRTAIAANAPEAFVKAQESGKKELAALRPRIPTLRIQISPPASSLQKLSVQMNGVAMPVELVGIARPVNPGIYRVTASATGMNAAPVDVDLKEGATKTVDIKLTK